MWSARADERARRHPGGWKLGHRACGALRRRWTRRAARGVATMRSSTEIARLSREPSLPPVDRALPENVAVTAALERAVAGAELVVAAVPSHGLRAVVRLVVLVCPRGAVIVSAAKGLEDDSLRRMSQVIAEEAGSGHAGRRAVGAQLRRRSRARSADRCRWPRRPTPRRRRVPGALPRTVVPAVRERRCGGRRDWRGAEERDCHRRGRRSRASASVTTRWRR